MRAGIITLAVKVFTPAFMVGLFIRSGGRDAVVVFFVDDVAPKVEKPVF